MVHLLTTLLLAGAAAWLLTWTVRRCAPRIGLVDKPDGWRKLHTDATALGGGLAVWVGSVVIVGGSLMLDASILTAGGQNGATELVGLFVGSLVILVVGIVDDVHGLRGRQKLAGQLLAVGCLYWSGLVIDRFELLGVGVELGLLAIPFTTFWMLGAVNSINLLDGTDGLASTMGIAICGTIAVLGYWAGQPLVVLVAAVFAASLIGFLWFNLPPATIFLGDAGSMLIGFVAGALVLQSSLKAPGTVLLAAPFAIWTIPIFDTGAAIMRRKLSGRSLYSTDRGHLHHCLNSRFGNRRTLLVVAVGCLVTAAGALASVAVRNDVVALVCSFAVIGMFVSARLFGHVELQLLLARVSKATRTTGLPVADRSRKGRLAWQRSVRLQGSRRWELLWETLIEYAEKLDLSEIDLNVNLPTLQEGFHATWQSGRSVEEDSCWCVRIPLVVGEQVAAVVGISGTVAGECAGRDIAQVLDLLQPFEEQLGIIVHGADEVNADPIPAPHNRQLAGVAETSAGGVSEFLPYE